MRRLPVLIAAALLAFPGQGWCAALPAPPQQMFEAMLLYAEQGDFAKAGRILEKLAPLLDELRAAYGTDLAGETREALKKGGAWEAQTAILKVVYYHMKLELSAALKAEGRSAIGSVRMAYLDYLFLVPRLKDRDKKPAAEAELRFKAVHKLVISGLAASEMKEEARAQVREIERICLQALEAGGKRRV